ncbi:AlbA family DNA-binding domain-containing protein [Amycolatopsis taiwanensis]|uniref:AlbA family DNA-binding domain-containing protein n=1 Tax=Amycolatopsis taiwanensis TaxID=342230 RepID=UPI0012EBBBE7|nr:RNA-binding domain-containing protein [Amycolatopsis taiwanensis]
MDRGHAFASLEVLGPASVTSLHAAMKEVCKDYDYSNDDARLQDLPLFAVTWSTDSTAEFDDDTSLAEPVSLSLMRDGNLLVELCVGVGPAPRTGEDRWSEGARLLDSWLQARGGKLVNFEPGDFGFRWYWKVYFSVPLRGKTVTDVHLIGADAIRVLETHAEGEVTLDSLRALLRSGHAEAIVGMPEGQLLEAKRHLHLEDEKSRLELAKDVSAIANSPTGGLLVVGLATRRESGRDVVSTVHPFRDTGQARRVRSVLDRLIYPPIDRLDVSLVPAGGSYSPEEHLLVVIVRPQPPELTPFIVTGVVVDQRVFGSYIGLFERRGEDTVASTAASIHAGLSAGLALLRGRPAQQ